MDWLSTLAPTAATLLGGPLAGLAVKFLGGLGVPGDTAQAVTAGLRNMGETAEGRIKLAEIDAALKAHVISAGVEIEKLAAANLAAVNATMQAETRAEHWPSYSWRPFVGFVFGAMMLGVYFVLPLARVPVPVVPTEAWLALGAVLGVASWYRGKAQADPNNSMLNRG
jgi:hypothetical protein